MAPDAAGGVFELSLLGDDEALARLAASGLGEAALGIGDNDRRRLAAERALASGFDLVRVRHPGAQVGRGALIAAGAAVLAGAVVGPEARIGTGAIVNSPGLVEHDARVGAYANVAPGARLLGGASLGSGALLGAGAVVLDDVPAGARVVGVPARPQAWASEA